MEGLHDKERQGEYFGERRKQQPQQGDAVRRTGGGISGGTGVSDYPENFSSRFGEIDLVAREGRYLVFVEVKYRATARGGHPLEAVDAGKRRRIRKTADFYCLRYGYGEDTPCRFDVVGMLGDEVIHVRDAFER